MNEETETIAEIRRVRERLEDMVEDLPSEPRVQRGASGYPER